MQSKEKVHIDPLTHLPDHFYLDIDLEKEITRSKDDKQHLALLYLDIDFFKRVNDCYGGDIGDLLLREVAQRLAKIIRTHDFLAHLGADKYAVILTEIESTHETGHISQRIIEELNQPFVIDNHVIIIGLSIGIAYYPIAGHNVTELHKSASMALASAKVLGRNNYQFYTEALAEKNNG